MSVRYLDVKLTAAQIKQAKRAIAWYQVYGGSGVRLPVYAQRGMFELYHALMSAEREAGSAP